MKKRLFLWPVALCCLLPFALMLIGSLRVGGQVSAAQYSAALLQSPRFFRAFWNSVLYTAVILAVNLPISLLAAYGFSRFRFRGREALFWLYIVMMLMPFQATVVPQYLTLKWIGVIRTPWAVVLPNMFATFGTFLMTQYMRGFDGALYEAAQIDNMGGFRMFTRLVLPICRPVISALCVLSFVNYWSLVEQPTVFLERTATQPLSLRLGSPEFAPFAFAGGVLFSILPLLLYWYSYEDLQAGISLTGGGKAERGTRRFSLAMRCFVGFLCAMAAFTFVTQKVAPLMTPSVSVYTVSRRSPVLTAHRYVVPEACVQRGGLGGVVRAVLPDPYDGVSLQAVDLNVEIEAEEGGYVAITGALRPDTAVICHATRPVVGGDTVIVIGEAFDEENDR